MEDFLKFLLMAGVILVGIFKEVNKNKKPGKRPVSPMPSSDEIKPDAVPMPEAWSNPKRKKKREEVSVAASIANSAAQDKRNIRQNSQYNAPDESSPGNEQDFTIRSAEEARRAIIWGEILQRKY